MTERLLIVSTWILVTLLTLFPTAFSWRNCLLMAWMGPLIAGKTLAGQLDPKNGEEMELSPAAGQSQVVFPRAQY